MCVWVCVCVGVCIGGVCECAHVGVCIVCACVGVYRCGCVHVCWFMIGVFVPVLVYIGVRACVYVDVYM